MIARHGQLVDPVGPSDPVDTDVTMRGRALHKRYGTAVALAGVDFAVLRGEALAIMGPSGSGKSTLLHCLAGWLRPDSGEITLREERIDELSENQLSTLRRREFGFVFQFGQLLPELPAVENIALPLLLDGIPKREAVSRARPWLERLGLDGLDARRPGELSGGQAQRVAIARALVAEPAVVFADEPTGALDQATGEDVIRVLTGVTRDTSTSLVVVTHDAKVAAYCDRTLLLRDGSIDAAAAGSA